MRRCQPSATPVVAPPSPQFELLFTCTIVGGALNTVHGPVGKRINSIMPSGNFYDPSGKLVATVVPGTGVDNGMMTDSGYLFIDARMTIRWEDDHTLAFLYFSGVGTLGQHNTCHIHMEADESSVHKSLSYRFLISQEHFTQSEASEMKIYGIKES